MLCTFPCSSNISTIISSALSLLNISKAICEIIGSIFDNESKKHAKGLDSFNTL